MMTHLKFPSLEQFNKVFARETYGEARRSLTYRAKIKLHGTNIGLRVYPDGHVVGQSRKHDLSLENDLNTFARWLEPQKTLWAGAAREEVMTFFGEWAGPGIGKGDAVQRTDRKRFYIFALGIGTAPHHQDGDILTPAWMITCPLTIMAFLPEGISSDEVRVLPYEDEEPMVFDFADEAQIEEALALINRSVDAVAEVDPYISRHFDIRHPGEGFVLVPHANAAGQISTETYSRLAFKTKTEKHRVRKQGKAASPKEPLPASAAAFVETFCTPARLEQALEEVCGGTADIRKTGQVIAWMTSDIQKEAAAEIAALPVPFDRLKGEIAAATRSWFMHRIPASDAA